tara:strand:+ start:5834 stop:8245 length:2412 start_codon:yes stop_codon:yes gene_type:complete
MKKLFFLALILLLGQNFYSQCFEIESILVDACGPGSLEGENEMIRFKVGAATLNSNNLSANYPTSNSFLGICQNLASATATANLNATITGCGFLIEPIGGILPANANVFFLTSTSVDITANSFANLNDTLYVIYQCSGNTSGHFGNGGTGLKTLSISFSIPVGCIDAVTYNNSNLVGGNGAIVNFDPAGNDTYGNNGCQAPFSPILLTATNLTSLSICPGDSVNLTATYSNGIQSVLWSEGTGSFLTPNNSNTTYYSLITDVTPYFIKLNGITTCNDTIKDSLQITFIAPSNPIITEADTVDICTGSTITLHATGASSYLWSNSLTTADITVSTPGDYFVTSNNISCPSDTDSVHVNIIPNYTVTISGPDTVKICQGNDTTLYANGASNYLWSTFATSDSIITNTTGLYYAFANTTCPSDTDSVYVNVIPNLTVSINEPSIITLCDGETITLTTTGPGPFLWNNGSTFDSLVVTTAGNYSVTSSNSCSSVNDAVQVNINPSITVNISEPDTFICSGESITLHGNGASSYIWSTGETTANITVATSGIYTLTGNGSCPSNTTTIQVTVIPKSNPLITEGDSLVLCQNTSIVLHATGGHSYQWNTTETSSSIQINVAGIYFVKSINGNCIGGYDTIVIRNNIRPSAQISGDSLFCTGRSTTLNALGSGNFSWSTGAVEDQLVVRFTEEIILTAENSCGILASDTLLITEEDCDLTTDIYIPNAFTPNGNGINEIFKVIGTNIMSINVKIYNRWGELVFEWNDINDGWDGTHQNEPAPSGVYVYRIKIKTINDNVKSYVNSIVLVR